MKRNEFAVQIVRTLLAKSQAQPGTCSRVAFVSKRQAQYLPPRPWSWAGEVDGVPVEVSIEDLNHATTKMHWHPRQCNIEMRVARNILLERGVVPPPGTFIDDCPVRYGAPPIDDRYK